MSTPKGLDRLKLEPLDIKCTTTDCENDFHCFKPKKQASGSAIAGACNECGAELVDWKRVHSRDIDDSEYTIDVMCYEMIRYAYWHVPFTQRAINYAKRKGISGLESRVPTVLARAVGPRVPFHDGFQTGKSNSPTPIPLAQHATASCCRKCIEYWHDIPQGRELLVKEIEYLSRLAIGLLPKS